MPLPVAPVMSSEARPATRPSSTAANPGARVPQSSRSPSVSAPRRTVRSEIVAHPSTTGGRAAWRRVPSGSRASTRGLASSSRRPPREARRTASSLTSLAAPNPTPARSRPIPRSIHTSSGPLTSTSVTPGVSRSRRSGPTTKGSGVVMTPTIPSGPGHRDMGPEAPSLRPPPATWGHRNVRLVRHSTRPESRTARRLQAGRGQ